MAANKNAYRILFEEPEWQRPLGTPRWQNNIKLDLKESSGLSQTFTHLKVDVT
jgi:hypothetical protein